MNINIRDIVSDEQCYEAVRKLRWPDGIIYCPSCKSKEVIKNGRDDGNHKSRQRYLCYGCNSRFDDLTNSIFQGHHQPLKVWILFLYFMGLNLSNSQIAKELNLDLSVAQYMATIFRSKVFENTPKVELSNEVEFDEVYITAGHKGNPEAVKKRNEKDAEIN